MEVLTERRQDLHEALLATPRRDDPQDLLEALVRFLSDITNRGAPEDEMESADACCADDLVNRSALVRAALEANSWLASAPNAPAVQHWTATSGHLQNVREPAAPSAEKFRASSCLDDSELMSRPLPGGLFTSSAMPGRANMWNLFLKLNSNQNEDANLWRRPWLTWLAIPRPDARVLRVRSAADWVRLSDAHPLLRPDGLSVVNWREVSARFDAVHIAAPAVCAIDGLKLRSAHGITAPTHFTVECTLWLTWVFESWELIETP